MTVPLTPLQDLCRTAIIDCLLQFGIPVRNIALLCHVRNELITERRAILQTPTVWQRRRSDDAPHVILDYRNGVTWDILQKRYGGRNRVSKILYEAGLISRRGRGNHNPRRRSTPLTPEQHFAIALQHSKEHF